jgi:lipopolysaccharide export system ATP-binding protein
MAILRSEGLVKTYGSRRVVDGVGFHVDEAEIVGLMGPNGAGKTTSFRMTCGMIEPDQGKVTLQGIDVTDWPMYRRCKEGGMGYLAQESSVFRKLTVEQNLLCVMELLQMKRAERKARCDELLEQFKITHIRKSKAGSLSGGERRRLEIARCLVSEPRIILLDEPFTGIDPVTVQSIQGIIRDLKTRGISILITDHQVRETLQITDRNYIVIKGQVEAHGSAEDVCANENVKRLYFGDALNAGIVNSDANNAAPPSLPHRRPVRSPSASSSTATSSIGTKSRTPRRVSVHEEDTLDAE